MAQIIDGRKVSQQLRARMRQETALLKEQGIVPGLAVVLVGDDAASRVYVNNKRRACAELGIYSQEYLLPEQTAQQELLALIEKLNSDPQIHGILVQLPLPEQIDTQAVINAISPDKDVDAFHPENVGRMVLGNDSYQPCTPAGIIALLDAYGIVLQGKHCVVLGRSNIVGKPIAMLMMHRNATVTICHSYTDDLESVAKKADILIAAVGKPRFVTAQMIKKGAVVIDVGIHRGPDGKLCGDVDFRAAEEKASYITPVPGGVGPMTITMLMKNTIASARRFAGL